MTTNITLNDRNISVDTTWLKDVSHFCKEIDGDNTTLDLHKLTNSEFNIMKVLLDVHSCDYCKILDGLRYLCAVQYNDIKNFIHCMGIKTMNGIIQLLSYHNEKHEKYEIEKIVCATTNYSYDEWKHIFGDKFTDTRKLVMNHLINSKLNGIGIFDKDKLFELKPVIIYENFTYDDVYKENDATYARLLQEDMFETYLKSLIYTNIN